MHRQYNLKSVLGGIQFAQGLMLSQQLETALAVDQSMDCSTLMKSEKSQKMDLELLLLQLELTQTLKRFLPLMQETLSALYSTTYEKELSTTHLSLLDSMNIQHPSTASFINRLNQAVVITGSVQGNVVSASISSATASLDFSWVAQDDSNAIQNAIVDAKGDLISATAADTKVSISPTFPRYVIKKAINDTVNAVGSTIFAAKVTTFTFNAAQTTYDFDGLNIQNNCPVSFLTFRKSCQLCHTQCAFQHLFHGCQVNRKPI